MHANPFLFLILSLLKQEHIKSTGTFFLITFRNAFLNFIPREIAAVGIGYYFKAHKRGFRFTFLSTPYVRGEWGKATQQT